jgi:hypothetical protein
MNRSIVIAVLVGVVVGLGIAGRHVHADSTQPALDRQLTERMVRALENQARQTERLVQATERCRK